MVKNYRIKKFTADIEPHEVFLDKLAHVKEEEIGVSEKKFEVPLRNRMSYLIFIIFILLAVGLFSKVFYFQIVSGKRIYTEAENNKGSANIIAPERGIVYDTNLKQLVLNSPAYDFVCDRARFSLERSSTGELVSSQEISTEIKNIADIFGITPEEITNKIQSSDTTQVLVQENIVHDKLLVLETKIDDLTGCSIIQNTARDYVYGPVFSQVLGYTGRINKEEYANSEGYSINGYIGKTGLEKYYESYLKGVPGQSKSTRPVANAKDLKEVAKKPIAGNNLVLNIDADLQKKVYDSLEASIKRVGAKKGAAVAMDPRTGAVLALVSFPSYDDNLFSGGISQADYSNIINDPSQPLFNRAISANYPTGSTIKPFEASAALQEKIISPTKQINDIGYILVKSQYDPNVVYKFSGVTPHGWVDMKKALAVSSNIYFYTVGGGYGDQQGLGPTRIKKYLSLFGWGARTGVDLPGEFGGFIPDPAWKKATKGSSWVDGDTYNLSIGQSDLQVTPLQLTTAYCVIANSGTLYKPQIVNKIISGSGKDASIIKAFSPQIVRQSFIDQENLQIVREGMRDGVAKSYGGSAMLNDLPVAVASKTGTAEIGVANHFNVWSSVFAPYENPEIVLVVTVENVQGFGAVTLPVAHDVLGWYFSGKK
jgi:penicillin-binding protein 2